MEDIELKRSRKEKELVEELTASAIMINHAKELIGESFLFCELLVVS